MSATFPASDCVVEANQVRWLGIDFSGDQRKWSPRCSKSNVWIAEIRGYEDALRLVDLRRVQQLQGEGSPFELLARLLSKRDFAAAGIDAPFSVPGDFIPNGRHKDLLDTVVALCVDKPFPNGRTFAGSVVAGRHMASPKPLRETERAWQQKGVNVRSTLWTGPRGGAPMTAVCLSLLCKTGCPIWPWVKDGPGLLVEAFPAAQLNHWKLPFQRYNDLDEVGASNRKEIVSFLEDGRLESGAFQPLLLSSADALDAVLCAFAAKAVSDGQLAHKVEAIDHEGQIAVHA
jgi:hypothetical protein